MNCKYCTEECRRSGVTKSNIQRYYCDKCHKYQQSIYAYKGCEQGISEEVEILTNNSCGIRSISRILKISKGKVINTIKKLYRERVKVKRVILLGQEYELDEMYTPLAHSMTCAYYFVAFWAVKSKRCIN